MSFVHQTKFLRRYFSIFGPKLLHAHLLRTELLSRQPCDERAAWMGRQNSHTQTIFTRTWGVGFGTHISNLAQSPGYSKYAIHFVSCISPPRFVEFPSVLRSPQSEPFLQHEFVNGGSTVLPVTQQHGIRPSLIPIDEVEVLILLDQNNHGVNWGN